jgi:hypothetical protein
MKENDKTNTVLNYENHFPLIFNPENFQVLNVRMDKKNFRKVFYQEVNQYLTPQKSESRLKTWMLQPSEIPRDVVVYNILNESLAIALRKQRDYYQKALEDASEKINQTKNAISIYEKGSELPL